MSSSNISAISRRLGTGFTGFDVDLQSPVGKSTKYSEAESLFETDNKCCRSSSAEAVFDLPRCFEDRKDLIVVRGAFRKGIKARATGGGDGKAPFDADKGTERRSTGLLDPDTLSLAIRRD